MTTLLKRIITVFSLLLFVVVSTSSAYAAAFTLSGSVKDTSGNNISDATIDVLEIDTSNVVATTMSDSSGNYSFSFEEGTYDLRVTPPSGSNLEVLLNSDVHISENTTRNFSISASLVELSGEITDLNDSPLEHVSISLRNSASGTYYYGQTNVDGEYAINVPTGTYGVLIEGSTSSITSSNIPQTWQVGSASFELNENTELHYSLDVKEVIVHVQDDENNPVEGALIKVPGVSNQNLQLNGQPAFGSSSYGNGITTDASGNARLLLFETPIDNGFYTILVTPPQGSELSGKAESGVAVLSNMNLNITLYPPVEASGVISDSEGNFLENVGISFQNTVSRTYYQGQTNSNGEYHIDLPIGSYDLMIEGNPSTTPGSNIPPNWQIITNNLVVSEDTVINHIATFKKITAHVVDPEDSDVVGASIEVNGFSTSQLSLAGANAFGSSSYQHGILTDSQGIAELYLYETSDQTGTYTFEVTPPENSEFTIKLERNITLTEDRDITITLSPPVHVTGRITDALGNPLENTGVSLQGTSSNLYFSDLADENGEYDVAVPIDNYGILIEGSTPNLENTPQNWQVGAPNIQIDGDTVIDYSLHVSKVQTHVQNVHGDPVENARIKVPGVRTNDIVLGEYEGFGSSAYNNGIVTDANGNADISLFNLNPSENSYLFEVTPPENSPYVVTPVGGIEVVGNSSRVITLAYENAPNTTISFSPDQLSDGVYANPVTISLSSEVADGSTLDATYYSIDNGEVQTYAEPFVIDEVGMYSIRYWSVDSNGVQEIQKTQNITVVNAYALSGVVYIDANSNGIQDVSENGYEGANITIDNGYSVLTDSEGEYIFEYVQSGTYQETLSLPSGYVATTTNPASIALSADTTQHFGITSSTVRLSSVNAGGSTTGDYVADEHYSGGSSYTSSASVDVASVTDAAPESVYQDVRYGNFTYTFSDLTPDADYAFRLHFNEVYWNYVGARVFDVNVNGQTKLDNYDIFESAGAKDKAVVAVVNATANSNGEITVQFVTEFDHAAVSGIELFQGTMDVPSPTPTPTLTVPFGVNSGGSTAGDYIADNHFSGGSLYTTANAVSITGVTNAAPEAAYKSVRYGNFSYTLPHLEPNEDYVLRLHFDEFYWAAIGSRVFDVAVNGSTVLDNYDIYEVAGSANQAVVEDIPVTADEDGHILLQFTSVVDNAMVSAIEIVNQE